MFRLGALRASSPRPLTLRMAVMMVSIPSEAFGGAYDCSGGEGVTPTMGLCVTGGNIGVGYTIG